MTPCNSARHPEHVHPQPATEARLCGSPKKPCVTPSPPSPQLSNRFALLDPSHPDPCLADVCPSEHTASTPETPEPEPAALHAASLLEVPDASHVLPPSSSPSSTPHALRTGGQSAHTTVEQPCTAEHLANKDWMFDRSEYTRLSALHGPFTQQAVNMSEQQLLSFDFAGHNTWCVPPFRSTTAVMNHYLACKARAPTTTSLMIVIPDRAYISALGALGSVSQLRPIQRYPAGCSPFTRSAPTDLDPARRIPVNPLSHSLGVYYDPPADVDPLSTDTLVSPVPPVSPLSPALHTPAGDPTSASSPLAFIGKVVAPPGMLSSPLLLVEATCHGKKVLILIDCGATRDFASRRAVHRLGFTPQSLGELLRVKLANGTISTTAHCISAPFSIGSWSETRTFTVTDLEGVDFILGKPWFDQYNPAIHWSSNTILTPFHAEALSSPCTPGLAHLSASKMAKCMTSAGTSCFIGSLKEILPDAPDPMKPSTSLSPDFQAQLHQLLADFHTTFDPPSGVNLQTGVSHTIDLKPDSKPPVHGLRRMSPAELEELQKQLTMYLEKGWIRPSSSAFGAPVVFARKSDGTLRFCVDYRALNDLTVKNAYPLPRIDDLIDHLRDARYFTSLDLSSAYHQIPMSPPDIHKTAFRTRYGHFEFTVMPFGLTNAPATCQQVMNDILRPYLDRFVAVYLDDLMIWSSSEQEHLDHIRTILEALKKANLHLKLSKCSFAARETKFLGYIISPAGVSADPKKLAAMANWPLPTTVTEVRSFLGFCNFYHRFVKNFSTIAAPLTALTSATRPFPSPLPPDAQDAFLQLKAAMLSAPVLCIPHTGSSATFELYTDASRVGVGAVLEQNGRPVCYESRKLSPAEMNYPVHELELLAVIHALRALRHYLEGCKQFTLFTDHRTLQYIFRQKELSRRQVGWLEILTDYQSNMDIRYLPGEKNRADALSRIIHASSPAPADSGDTELPSAQPHPFHPHLSSDSPVLPHSCATGLNWLHATDASSSGFEIVSPDFPSSIALAYAKDPYYTRAILPAWIRKCEDSLFRFRDRICVPADSALRTRILAEFHDVPSAGHPGYLRTLNAIARHFWWPHMNITIRQYVNSCDTCQRIKPSTQSPAGLLQPHAIPSRPWSHISMDLITHLPLSTAPDGKTYDSILTFVDLLTKQAFFVRCNEALSATGLAHLYIDNVYRLKGLSKFIVSDRDTRITSEFWQTLFHRLGSTLNLSTAYHPQTDGQSERAHRTIEQILRAYVDPMHDDWAVWLPLAEFAYNSATNATTTLSPFEANYGYQPSTPATLSAPLSHSHLFARGGSCQSAAQPLGNTATAAHDLATRLTDIHHFVQHQTAAAKAYQEAQANRHRRDLQFTVGSSVMLSTEMLSIREQPSKKFRLRWLGPFKVDKVVSPVSYRLQLPSSMKIHPVIHVSRLKAAVPSPPEFAGRRPSTLQQPAQAADCSPSEDFTVDHLQDVRINPGTRRSLQFLVRWGTPWEDPRWDSWEPLSGVRHTTAYDNFITTPAFHRFLATPEYLKFAQSFPRSCPPLFPLTL